MSEQPVDITNLKRSSGDYVIKIARPQRPSISRIEKEGDKYIAEISDPDVKTDIRDFLKTKEHVKDINPEDIETTTWEGFDIEQIIDLLIHISKKVSGTTPLPYQEIVHRRIYRSIILNDGELITVLFTRQSGKTYSNSLIIATCMITLPALAKVFPEQLGHFDKGFWCGIFAPVGDQGDILYRRVIEILTSQEAEEVYEDPSFNTGLDKRTGKLKNGSFVIMRSANPRSSIEGLSLHYVLLEESQGIDANVIQKAIEPMGAWTNATTVAIGTCDEKPGWFYNMIQLNKMSDVNRNLDTKNHWEFDYTEVIKYNPRYMKHVNEMKRKYTEESRYFQMKYALRWYAEEGKAVRDDELKGYTMYIRVPPTKYSSAPVVVGIDLAQKVNGTVVTVGKLVNSVIQYDDGKERVSAVQVCDWYELEGIPYQEQRSLIEAFLRPYTNIRVLCFDNTGVGVPFYDFVVSQWKFIREVVPYTFSSKSKAHLMNLFYEYLYSRRLIIPSSEDIRKAEKWQKFYLQMINLEKKSANGHTYLSKPERDGARDDYPDSLMLMLNAADIALKSHTPVETSETGVYTEGHGYYKPTTLESLREAYRNGPGKLSARELRRNKLIKGLRHR